MDTIMSTVGLALGGGGAKGFAHVGVLRALEQLNIKADLVVGTSMGGIIGAMYAAGLSVDRIETCLRATGLTVLASRERSHLGLLGRDKVVRWLHQVVGDVTFEQLARKLAECPPDVLLCPEVGHVGLFDTRQYDACLAAGMAAVYAHETELTALRSKAARPPRTPTFWQRLRKSCGCRDDYPR